MINISTIRVLQVLDKIDISSGVSSVVMNYYRLINKEEVIFDFIVHEPLNDDLGRQIESNNSKVYIMPALKLNNILKLLISIINFFSKHKEYNVIHVHIPNASIFYLGLAKIYKVKHRIIHSHNTKASDHFFKRIRNYVLFLPIKVLANHFWACSQIAALFLFGEAFCKKKKVNILPNAIDIEKFRFNETVRKQLRDQLNIENKFVIGNIGRFCYQKNQEFAIDVFYELHKLYPQSLLILLGDGEQKQQIIEKIAKLSIENEVLFLGVQKDVHLFYQAMDSFLLPSRFEGLPLVGIEAQVAGLPCLFSNTITKEAKITDQTEYLSITDSPSVWADKLLNISQKAINRNIIDYQIANFDIKKQVKGLENYYKEITEDDYR